MTGRFKKRLIMKVLVAAVLAATLLPSYLVFEGYLKLPPLNSDTPKMLYDNCLRMMFERNCAIMNTGVDIPKEVKQIFVAGYGSLDAEIYRNLRDQGPNMCKTIEISCTKEPHGEVCRLGVALYRDLN